MRYAGIDPGQDGACVVVGEDGQTVLAVQTWRDAESPPALTALDGVSVLALEEQFVGKGAHASLTLATWCGRLLAALPPELHVERPLGSEWRAKVFRCGRLRRAEAKRRALQAATPHLAGHVPHVTHDVAEAWCMARFARFWALHHLETTGSSPVGPPLAGASNEGRPVPAAGAAVRGDERRGRR